MSDTKQNDAAEAEVTVTATGQFGMTPEQFIGHLRANGFTGNTSTNPNYPGVVWIGFRN